ncbi:GNAT family N-acetyltransferase [Sanguibacter suaedae]|nr:GNAT family N-acetyltransferase [Sanguibacter suaedae]
MPIIEVVRPGAPAADRIVRDYMSEVASRYYGRPASSDEVDQALRDEPYDDLAGTTGIFLVALDGGQPVGCAGARFVDDIAELTKVYTQPSWRGRGVGSGLLAEIETIVRTRGPRAVRLDTRAELVEACTLYERRGFTQVPAFNDEPYSDRWYAKDL